MLARIGHVEGALNPGQPLVRDRLRESLAPLTSPRTKRQLRTRASHTRKGTQANPLPTASTSAGGKFALRP